MKSLYWKFAFSTILIMILSGLVSFVFSNIYYQHFLKEKNDRKMTIFVGEMADYIQGESNLSLDRYFDHLGSIGYQIFLFREDGSQEFYGASFRVKNLPASAVDTVLAGGVYHGIKEFPHKTFVTGFFANELKNSVGTPFTYDNQNYALFIRPDIKLLFNEMHVLFGWLFVTSIALSILFVLIGTKYLVKPIIKLNLATKKLTEGHFSIKLDINRKDEIGDLAGSFMNMASKLARVNNLRKEFISNVSHDIQSPLTNIKGYLNLLDQPDLSLAEKRNYMKIINSEITRLSYLSKQLLTLSSIENKKDVMELKEFDVASQIKKVIQQYQWEINKKNLMVSYSLPQTMMTGDPFLLYSVWENLLTNGIKYNIENGSIDISLSSSEDYIEVQFQDSGIGMAEEQMKRVYERFYRGDPSRSKEVGGTGLGLSIVQTVVHMHSGTISVESKKGVGTVFKIVLPLKPHL